MAANITGMLTEQRQMMGDSGAKLGGALAEGLFDLTDGSMGKQTMETKTQNLQDEMMSQINALGEDAGAQERADIVGNTILKLNSIGATTEATEGTVLWKELNSQAASQRLSVDRGAKREADAEAKVAAAEVTRQSKIPKMKDITENVSSLTKAVADSDTTFGLDPANVSDDLNLSIAMDIRRMMEGGMSETEAYTRARQGIKVDKEGINKVVYKPLNTQDLSNKDTKGKTELEDLLARVK